MKTKKQYNTAMNLSEEYALDLIKKISETPLNKTELSYNDTRVLIGLINDYAFLSKMQRK